MTLFTIKVFLISAAAYVAICAIPAIALLRAAARERAALKREADAIDRSVSASFRRQWR